MNFAERCESFISQNKFVDASELIKCEISKKSNSYDIKELNVAQFLRCEYLSSQEQSIFLLEVLRYLRNSTTTLENQQFLTENECFLQKLKVLFNQLMEQNNSEVLLKVILQLLVNIIVSNKESGSKVYTYFYDSVLECFYRKYNKYEVLALLYNIHLQNSHLPLKISLCEGVLDEAIDSSCEFAEFLIELFLSSLHFWSLYKKFDINKKILILQALQNMLITRHTKDIPELALQTLSEVFSESTSIIFQTMSCSTEYLEPYEISLVLEILGCLCGHEKYLRFLQNDKELIIRSGVILINLHRLGKQSENCFSSVQKLSELKEPNETIQNHPAFGFKVGLVRLIGNLCWKSKKMQDLVREAEVIPVLLDCCNIDARNPLIMQWVILAIRNLCENNLNNQAIIAGMHKEGTVSSALIEEMGLTLHNDENGGIRIIPLDINR